jgi:hypothetical protein
VRQSPRLLGLVSAMSDRHANQHRYLADHGSAESRLSPHGYGKTEFVDTNKTVEGRAQNRRVELVPNHGYRNRRRQNDVDGPSPVF